MSHSRPVFCINPTLKLAAYKVSCVGAPQVQDWKIEGLTSTCDICNSAFSIWIMSSAFTSRICNISSCQKTQPTCEFGGKRVVCRGHESSILNGSKLQLEMSSYFYVYVVYAMNKTGWRQIFWILQEKKAKPVRNLLQTLRHGNQRNGFQIWNRSCEPEIVSIRFMSRSWTDAASSFGFIRLSDLNFQMPHQTSIVERVYSCSKKSALHQHSVCIMHLDMNKCLDILIALPT